MTPLYRNSKYYKIVCPFSNDESFLNSESSSYIETIRTTLQFQENVAWSERPGRGKCLYQENKLFNIEVKEVIFDIPVHKSDEFDKRQDLLFKCKCKGSYESSYDVEIIISKEWCIIYTDCSCPDYKKGHQFCKHIYAALYWLTKNLPTMQNIQIVHETDIGYKDCKFNDFSKKEYLVSTYKTLTKHIDSYEITKLRLYEKACRYLVKGLKSMNDSISPWTDIELPKKFEEVNKDFNRFMIGFLDNDSMHNLGQNDDSYLFDHYFRLPYRKFTSLIDRIYNINESIALNPFTVTNIKDFNRIITTYNENKRILVANEELDVKEIIIPGNYKLLVFEIGNINKEQYDELISSYEKEPFYYKVDKNIYSVFKIDIK